MGTTKGMSGSPEVIAQRYELGPLLGRGGMGRVHAGTDLRLGRDVAIKVLRDDLAETASLRSRFEREARAAARIAHPNVVAIYDVGEDGGVPFIVMERLPGNTFAGELATTRVSQDRACALALEILSALDAAHQLGVIHRDIKPGNILLDPLAHAKVADFGIAKIAEETDHTTTGMLLGTASYLAPERLAGDEATPATDLYAVGVLLFEALAGRAPFRGDTPLATVQAITRGVQVPLGDLRPDLDATVVAVVERAMRPDPADRFESATAMAAALTAATRRPEAEFEPTERIPTSELFDPDATQPVPSTERVDASAVDATAVAQPRIGRPDLDEPVGSRTSRRRELWFVALAVVAVIVAGLLFSARTSGSGATNSTPPPTTPTSSIPAPLDHALDGLQQAVTP